MGRRSYGSTLLGGGATALLYSDGERTRCCRGGRYESGIKGVIYGERSPSTGEGHPSSAIPGEEVNDKGI